MEWTARARGHAARGHREAQRCDRQGDAIPRHESAAHEDRPGPCMEYAGGVRIVPARRDGQMDQGHQGDRDTAATSNRSKARRLRDLLAHARPVVSPGVYDGYSVRLVEAMGFSTAAITGSGRSNTRLVQPDIGIMSLLENVDACRDLARSVAIPITADADTGYGNAVTVYHTAQYFEEAGLAGINIEDQVSPKRCGHMRGKD